jgi:hypothetical protein
MSIGAFDPDDFIYGGPNQPGGDERSNALARWGRLTPLPLKMDAYYQGVPLRFDMLVVSNAALLIPNLSTDALSVTIQVQGQPIRYTVDGTTPTAAIGFRADAGSIITLGMREVLTGAQFIREGGTDATLAICQWS